MKTIKHEAVYKIADGVRARDESFGLLVISRTTPALSLNTDSKFVWNLLDGTRTVEDIIKAVHSEYSGNDVEENIETLLINLIKLGLIIDVI
jgi:methyltransferase-like protein